MVFILNVWRVQNEKSNWKVFSSKFYGSELQTKIFFPLHCLHKWHFSLTLSLTFSSSSSTHFFSLCLIISSPDFILSCFHVSSTVMFALDVMNIGISLPHDTNEYSILNYIRFLHLLTYIQHKTDIQRERSQEHHQFDSHFCSRFLVAAPYHTYHFISSAAALLYHFVTFTRSH